MVEASALVASLTGVFNLANSIKDAVDDTKLQLKTADLVSGIIDLQQQVLAMQVEYSSALADKNELEKKLAEAERWELEREKYELCEIVSGNFAYVSKSSGGTGPPKHYICANCYEDKKKSILNTDYIMGENAGYSCPRCKNEFQTNA